MTPCPECASANLEELGKEDGERQDDEHFISLTKFRCNECGCAFEVTERFEVETEVTKHGREFRE